MPEKVDHIKKLEESKMFIDKLNMEVVPYSVARSIIEEISSYKIDEALNTVTEALNGYFKQVNDLQKDL